MTDKKRDSKQSPRSGAQNEESSEPLIEIALIGRSDKLTFLVWTEQYSEKCFHVKSDEQYELILRARDFVVVEVKANQSSIKFVPGELPPTEMLDTTRAFMDSPNRVERRLTNMQAVDLIWPMINYVR